MPYQCNNCKKVHLDIPGFCDCGADMEAEGGATFTPSARQDAQFFSHEKKWSPPSRELRTAMLIVIGVAVVSVVGGFIVAYWPKDQMPTLQPFSRPTPSPPPQCKTVVRRYPSGEKMEEETRCYGYRDGVWNAWKHGPHRAWRRDGSKVHEGWFNMGEECGQHRMWDESGKVIDGFDKPPCPSF